MLVDSMVSKINVRRLYLEKWMTVVPANNLLTIIMDLLAGIGT
jgi:hypothetical protein